MTFQKFAQILLKLEQTSSRLEMTAILAKLFKQLELEEIPPAIYLMQGKLVPDYGSLEFNLSIKMGLRVLARLQENSSEENNVDSQNLFGQVDYSLIEKELSKTYKKLGDLGLLAEKILQDRKNNLSKELSLLEVFKSLSQIAVDSGIGSQERKVLSLLKLLKQLEPLSSRYVMRVVIGRLRLGFSKMTILDALSWSKTGDKTLSKILEQAYNRRADVGILAQEFLQKDNSSAKKLTSWLKQIQAVWGVPVVPALCQRLNSAQEIIEKIPEVIVEPKYDGMRVQLHISKKEIRAYTRNLEEVSHMFPELEKIRSQIKADKVILDTEAIGVDKKTGQFLPFQETITRKRKHGVKNKAQELPIVFFVFDILMVENRSLLNKTLQERKKLLVAKIRESEQIKITEFLETSSPIELQRFHEEQLAHGLEGAVIKKLNSKYVSGRKGWNWVKIKEKAGTSGKLNDTLDLIVMGYYFGRGKRTKFGIGAFLVGVLKPAQANSEAQILTIAKIGTGLTDEQWQELHKRLEKISTKKAPKNFKVHKNLIPDVWVEPKLVVEIAADELTNSPVHSAKQALRFPRLVKFRDDKSAEQATTLAELAKIKVAA